MWSYTCYSQGQESTLLIVFVKTDRCALARLREDRSARADYFGGPACDFNQQLQSTSSGHSLLHESHLEARTVSPPVFSLFQVTCLKLTLCSVNLKKKKKSNSNKQLLKLVRHISTHINLFVCRNLPNSEFRKLAHQSSW